jgi:hypothetical protein
MMLRTVTRYFSIKSLYLSDRDFLPKLPAPRRTSSALATSLFFCITLAVRFEWFPQEGEQESLARHSIVSHCIKQTKKIFALGKSF